MTDNRPPKKSRDHDDGHPGMTFTTALRAVATRPEQQGLDLRPIQPTPYVLGLALVNMPGWVRTTLTVSAALGVIGGLLSQTAVWLGSGTLGLIGMGAIAVGFTAAVVVSCRNTYGGPAPRWSGTGKALLVPLALVAAGVVLTVSGFTGITLAAFALAACAFAASFYAVPAVGGERA